MADPRNELADIVAPAAPVVTGAGDVAWMPWAAGGVTALLAAALLIGVWYRRRPARALRKLATAIARREDSLAALAARLDAWTRARFRLARVAATQPPAGVDAGGWAAWSETLARLRFAPPGAASYDELADLCRRAREWKRRDPENRS
jgi:hypothetical protein